MTGLTTPDPRTPAQILASLTAPGAPFAVEVATVNGIEHPLFKAMPPHLGVYFEKCRAHGDAPFLIFEDERLSYGETYDRACRLAHALVADMGVRRGDRVAIAMRNYPEWGIAFMAIVSIGAVAVPLNGWWETEELDYALRDSGARVVLADGERALRLAPLVDPLGLDVISVRREGADLPGVRALETLVEKHTNGSMPDVRLCGDDDAMIMYTSGSTGYPKGVVSTHRAVLCSPMSWLCALTVARIKDGSVNQKPVWPPKILLTIPLFHGTALHSVFILSVLLCRSIVMMRKWNADDAAKLIERERITQFNGVPTMSYELLNLPDIERYDLSSLNHIAAGGAARPPEQVARLKKIFPNAHSATGYGLTETNAMGAVISRENYQRHPSSVGKPLAPLVRVKIVSESGKDVATAVRGEILIKSPSNARGYWNKPEETAQTFVDGWVKTGDIGCFDEEGFLYIVDRKKDIIIRGGENISCLEVEAKIHEHEAVHEVSVFGQPDERLGEVVCAVIYGHDSLNQVQLQDFLRNNLAKFKIPERITIVDAPLPRLGSGKIDKQSVKTLFQNGKY